MTAALSGALRAQPTPIDTTGNAMGLLPGTYPTTVTAANVNIAQGAAELGGGGSDNLAVSIPNSGPIKWTESRHNEGDIAMLIGPGDPNDPDYAPPVGFFNNYRPLAGDPAFAETTIAWRVNFFTGGALATVRRNGVDYGPSYTAGGTPIGTIHGVAYFNQDFAQGWGYNMSDGMFANGGNGSSDLQMGIAGFQSSDGEASISYSAAYFPYEQGWVGAWVTGGDAGEAVFASSSPDLPTSSVNWDLGQATVTLPGVNSASDGMLFVAPSHANNATNIAAAFPTAGGWKVTVREDDDADFTGANYNFSPDNQFQFVYIPYSATNLIGGHVNGGDASLFNSAGDDRFDIARTADGQYALSVYEADGQTKLTESDGMLILSNASALEGDGTVADRGFFSYEYDADTGNFIIEVREKTAELDFENSENIFGDVLTLEDTDFYFAWVDFTNPLSLSLPGDYNEDGSVNAADYTVWRDGGSPDDTQAGYDLWKANFGQSVGTGSSSAVPEPSAVALAVLLLGMLPMVRVRR
jgi:hypothetical protein